VVVATGDTLTGLRFERSMTPATPPPGRRVETDDDSLLDRARAQVVEYLSGRRREFDLPLATHGDDFSERTWALLHTIGYGETTTYGAIAEELGNRQLAQRVGQVVGRNPIAIIIPCHRVIGADGSLVGFGGGLDRKRRLLDLEEPPERRAERLF
jgi:methylated-DNA-[protein]-cysteine S-methyltransferase